MSIKIVTDTKDTISLEEYGIVDPYLASTRITFYVLLHNVVRNEIQRFIDFFIYLPKGPPRDLYVPRTNKGIHLLILLMYNCNYVSCRLLSQSVF